MAHNHKRAETLGVFTTLSMCFTIFALQYFSKSFEEKVISNDSIWHDSRTTVNSVNGSTIIRICSFHRELFEKGPKWSMCIVEKGIGLISS